MAFIVNVPAGKLDTASIATPPLRAALPINLLPFLNVTVPVGVGPAELTVAVNVTVCPYIDGFKLAASTVLVVFCSMTVCAIELEYSAW
jgi:hypothetical protein